MLTITSVAIQLAIADGRVSEHGNKDGCQSHARAKLYHGILFVTVIDIGLDSRRLLHHALAQPADFGHIGPHDSVPFFWHPLDFMQSAHRLHAQSEENNVERLRNLQQLADVLSEFSIGAVNAVARFTAKLDLSAGL